MPIAITDNWLLQLACYALEEGRWLSYTDDYARALRVYRERTSALLQLIDLLILYDEIYYDEAWAHTWRRMGSLDMLRALVPADLPKEAIEEIRASAGRSERGFYDDSNDEIIRDGSFFYLGLASAIGVPYWPSPARATFIAQAEGFRNGPFFTIALRGFLDDSLRQIEEEVLRPLSLGSLSKFNFVGFSSVVLSSSGSKDSILSTALEVRESREAKALRSWLTDMERSLMRGDVYTISHGMGELDEVLRSIRKNLRLDVESTNDIQLEVGLAPAVSFGPGALRRVLTSFSPRPLHVSFLRSTIENSLRNRNTDALLSRLFQTPQKEISNAPRVIEIREKTEGAWGAHTSNTGLKRTPDGAA